MYIPWQVNQARLLNLLSTYSQYTRSSRRLLRGYLKDKSSPSFCFSSLAGASLLIRELTPNTFNSSLFLSLLGTPLRRRQQSFSTAGRESPRALQEPACPGSGFDTQPLLSDPGPCKQTVLQRDDADLSDSAPASLTRAWSTSFRLQTSAPTIARGERL